ncbi:hypothetical protein KUH03_01295 [Sphingobacterium sp. E70]|uniref:hypothetical protein n=1 Tax=Sphingobacterium sp. E70 TaxID=2853439 RepID=UPI00211D0AE4|nr:hypothetical protein [Sphingobacterium sp. E70]ULT25672.1 hypothetical protein KUH03_01295 [Sphingobacterium sp. E70]
MDQRAIRRKGLDIQLDRNGDTYDPKMKDCNLDDPWFRKTITLKETVADARIYVASIGFHELYVNGKKSGTRF